MAVENISFGAHRIAAGFTKLSVEATELRFVDLGAPFGVVEVPTSINVTAEKP